MPARRQGKKKSEPGFRRNPTKPGGVGGSTAGTPVIPSSVLARSSSCSQQLPMLTPTASAATTVKIFKKLGTFVEPLSQHLKIRIFKSVQRQIQKLRQPITDPELIELAEICHYNLQYLSQQSTSTSAPFLNPDPISTAPTIQRYLSLPRSRIEPQTRLIASATTRPIPNPISARSSTSTGQSATPRAKRQKGALVNGSQVGLCYLCPPGRNCGVQIGFKPHPNVLNLLPNPYFFHANNNQQLSFRPIQPKLPFNNGNINVNINANGNGHFSGNPPLAYQQQQQGVIVSPAKVNPGTPPKGTEIPNNVDFSPLHCLSDIAAIRREDEERAKTDTWNERVFQFQEQFLDATSTPERVEILIKEIKHRDMANGLSIKQEAMDHSSPEDSGDQVLDLRKSTSDKLCVWCGKKTSIGEDGVESEFCSEICFDQFRRDSFKKRAACMWCNNANHGMINLSLISSLDESKFCSEHCLTQFKVRLFCEETSAHLEQLKEIQMNGGTTRNNNSVPRQSALNELITPELWLRKQPSHANSKKGSPVGTITSSPNQTLSSGCDSPAGSPQSSHHSSSPTIVPNPNYNPQRVVAQVPRQIFAAVVPAKNGNSNSNGNGGGTNGRRRAGAVSPLPVRNSAQSVAPKERSGGRQSLASQRKRMKSSSSAASSNSAKSKSQPGTTPTLQHQLLVAPTTGHGIAGNGINGNGIASSHSSSRRSIPSSTLTSGNQTLTTPQIQITGPRQGVPLINGNGINPLAQPGFLSGLGMISGSNQAGTSSLGLPPGMGFHLPTENGFGSAPNGAIHPNPLAFVAANSISIQNPNQLLSFGPQRISSGNPTPTSVSTQTETNNNTSRDWLMNAIGLGNRLSCVPPATVLVPFPIPIPVPIPIPIPIFLGGQIGDWQKPGGNAVAIANAAKVVPIEPCFSTTENKLDELQVKKEIIENHEKNEGANEAVIDESEMVENSKEDGQASSETPTDAGANKQPSDYKTD